MIFHPKNGTDIACVLSIVSPSVVELDFLVKLLHDQRLKALYLQLISSNSCFQYQALCSVLPLEVSSS